MGIRDQLSKNPAAAMGVLGAVFGVTALLLLYGQFRGTPGDIVKNPQDFYSSDDGKSFFEADAGNVVPFKKDGREAVKAYVFKCKNGTKFVGYLERLSPTALKNYEAAKAGAAKLGEVDLGPFFESGTEQKAPGSSEWVNRNNFEKLAVAIQVKCPDGGSDVPERVLP